MSERKFTWEEETEAADSWGVERDRAAQYSGKPRWRFERAGELTGAQLPGNPGHGPGLLRVELHGKRSWHCAGCGWRSGGVR